MTPRKLTQLSQCFLSLISCVMKLIQQTSLHFREGNFDKVYKIDLCEVGADTYVVNFR